MRLVKTKKDSKSKTLLLKDGIKVLPYYCEVEYLESSGNQYIDTLLSYKDSKYFDIETVLSFNVVNARQEQGANYGGYYGIQNTGYF